MNYPQIANIVCKTSYTLHENKYNARTFTTTNSLIKPAEKTYYEFATGMKTGFTQQAGSCLIASAKKENMEFSGGEVTAEHMNERIQKIFLLSGLHKLIKVNEGGDETWTETK